MIAKRHEILLVEDDFDIRTGLTQVLQDEGYTILQAANGKDALALLRSLATLPNLILLDMMMPVMDGPEFRAEQRTDPLLGGIPVVILTADTHAPEKAQSMGVAGALAKPIGIDELLLAVKAFF